MLKKKLSMMRRSNLIAMMKQSKDKENKVFLYQKIITFPVKLVARLTTSPSKKMINTALKLLDKSEMIFDGP